MENRNSFLDNHQAMPERNTMMPTTQVLTDSLLPSKSSHISSTAKGNKKHQTKI